mmetsp:Transcript_13020/g.25863  ORF Transcript_13020/g.25863 Transcript_13020/m.25863 type:complete len:245 (-) Transcript_13020:455-1189(-)
MVEPALSALLADPARDALGDFRPLCDTGVYAVDDDLVLLLRPWSLDQPGLQDLLPPVEALDVAPLVTKKVLSYHLPVLGPYGRDSCPQLLVLLLSPSPPSALASVLLVGRAPPGTSVLLAAGVGVEACASHLHWALQAAHADLVLNNGRANLLNNGLAGDGVDLNGSAGVAGSALSLLGQEGLGLAGITNGPGRAGRGRGMLRLGLLLLLLLLLKLYCGALHLQLLGGGLPGGNEVDRVGRVSG